MAQKTGVEYTKTNIVNLPAPLLRNVFKSHSIGASIARSPYSMALDAEGFRVVSWIPDCTPRRICPRMTGVRPAFIKSHPAIGVKLLQIDAMTPIARIYMQGPTLAQQIDPASAQSLPAKEGVPAGKWQLAMRVLHATTSISEPVPTSVTQNAIDRSHLKAFAASDRAK